MLKIIRTTLPITYTLAGDNRDASATQAADAVISFKSLESANGETDYSFYGVKSPNSKGAFFVNRARLIPGGGNGLLPPNGKIAAEISLIIGGTTYKFAFSEFGVWEKKGFSIFDAGSEALTTKIKAGSVVRIDDYNIQQKFVGGQVSFILEIEEAE